MEVRRIVSQMFGWLREFRAVPAQTHTHTTGCLYASDFPTISLYMAQAGSGRLSLSCYAIYLIMMSNQLHQCKHVSEVNTKIESKFKVL